jgi:hypothetical protein
MVVFGTVTVLGMRLLLVLGWTWPTLNVNDRIQDSCGTMMRVLGVD